MQLSQLKDLGMDIYLEINFKNLHIDLQNKLCAIYPDFNFENKKIHLLGSSGDQIWKRIKNINAPHRLNQYSLDCINKVFPNIAEGQIFYPTQSNKHFPILSVASATGFCAPSPIGLHISAQFGLWFSFRAVFVSEIFNNVEYLSKQKSLENPISICNNCQSKPCLGEKDFWNSRSACPIQSQLRYEQDFIDYLKQEIILSK